MTKVFSNGLGIAISTVLCVVFILFAIYPYRPFGVIGWLVLILIAVPIVLGLELVGKGLLENKLVTRLGRISRVIFGIIAVLLLAALIWIMWDLVKPFLRTWG